MSDYDADLAWALQAHHDAIVRHASTLVDIAQRAAVAKHPNPYRLLHTLSSEVETIGRELALGLEGLQRLIDSAKTVQLPISDIARVKDEE